MAYSSFVTIVA
ncbi:hypothetical protein LINPERPRIM_LOCUS33643 [Linum perenne]